MGELKQTRGAQQDCQERVIYFVESMVFHLHLGKICGKLTVRVATTMSTRQRPNWSMT
jgi:hypothetical protein